MHSKTELAFNTQIEKIFSTYPTESERKRHLKLFVSENFVLRSKKNLGFRCAELTPKMKKFVHVACEFYKTTPDSLLVRSRKPNLVFVRQMISTVLYKNFRISYSAIGKLFGGQDHSTVMYSINTMEDLIFSYANTKIEYNELCDMAKKINYEI